MIAISVEEAARAMNATALSVANPGMSLGSVSIDSRKTSPGQCFIAIKGDQFDGHDFVSEAVRRGAETVVHSQPVQAPSHCVLLRVDNTLQALQSLAGTLRRRWNGPLIAITGSMGKTTTRSFTTQILSRRFEVRGSHGNLNNHIGLPLSLLCIKESDEVVVVELGMNHAGEISRLGEICEPDLGVITNVAPAHLEFFHDLSGVAAAKEELLESLGPNGLFIFNQDDPLVCSMAARYAGPAASFGLKRPADAQVRQHTFSSLESMDFVLRLQDGDFDCTCGFAGTQYLYNIAAAAAIAQGLGMTGQDICRAIRRLEIVGMRGTVEVVRLASGGTVSLWDDSYNSNPKAVEAVLDTLAALPRDRRRVAVLGDMLELGDSAEEFHIQIGHYAVESGVDLLVTVGPMSQKTFEAARERGGTGSQEHFPTTEEAARFLKSNLRAADVVLVKGSRGARMDRIVAQLVSEQEAVQ